MKLITLLFALAISVASQASWSTFHGDNQRTGRTAFTIPANPTVRWTANMLGKVISQPVVAPNGTIYVGPVLTEELVPRLVLNAVNPNGTIKWRFECDFMDKVVRGTPAVDSNNRVYFGTAKGKFYCVDTDGNLVWSFQGNAPVSTDVLVASDGNIYARFGTRLYSFTPAGVVRWFSDMSYPEANWIVETLQGNIIVAGPGGVQCRTPSSSLLWTLAIIEPQSPIVIPDGRIVTCYNNVNWSDPLTGNILQSSTGGTAYGEKCVDASGNIFVGSGNAISKFSSMGSFLANYDCYAPNGSNIINFRGAQIVDGAGKVFVGMGTRNRVENYEKVLLTLNSNCVKLGTVQLGNIVYTASPAVSNEGRLLIGSLDGLLYSMGNP